MKIIVTGGAGFIGSCIVASLNQMGYEDIIIVDNIAETEKWRNLSNKKFLEYANKKDFLQQLSELEGEVSHIIHMGACSSTTERDFDYLYKNNFEFTCALWKFSVKNKSSFIYASSAATYGDGSLGFSDTDSIKNLRPLNGYGYTKQLFDLWTEKQTTFPGQYAGLKFFNVYGPNEYFKGSMASVIFHAFNQIKTTGKAGLFKSYKKEFRDGGQLRDFVYVKDVCKVINFLMENPKVNGIYNVGTGKSETFNALVSNTFKAMNLLPNIEYIDMPELLRPKYQYYTQSTMDKLRKAGYQEKFHSLEEGIKDYVQTYLEYECRIW